MSMGAHNMCCFYNFYHYGYSAFQLQKLFNNKTKFLNVQAALRPSIKGKLYTFYLTPNNKYVMKQYKYITSVN